MAEKIHGSIPHGDGGFGPRSFFGRMFGMKKDTRRVYDLFFTDRRIIRAKISDGISAAITGKVFVNPFAVLSHARKDLDRFKTGEHDPYKEQRENYSSMDIEQIITFDKYNRAVDYSEITKVSITLAAGGKMARFLFETEKEFHVYMFPADYMDRAQQLVKTHLSEKYQ